MDLLGLYLPFGERHINGFIINAFGDRYEDDGDQLWLVGTAGDFDGSSATIDVLRFSGMGFGDGFDPGSVSNEVVGSMTFSFTDCNNGSVTFAPVTKGLTGFTTDIERITSIASLGCGSKAQIDRMGRPFATALSVSLINTRPIS